MDGTRVHSSSLGTPCRQNQSWWFHYKELSMELESVTPSMELSRSMVPSSGTPCRIERGSIVHWEPCEKLLFVVPSKGTSVGNMVCGYFILRMEPRPMVHSLGIMDGNGSMDLPSELWMDIRSENKMFSDPAYQSIHQYMMEFFYRNCYKENSWNFMT